MASYKGFCEGYGIEPLSADKEAHLSKYEKQTRNNKMKMIDTCNHAVCLITTLNVRIKNVPALDDEKHAALVQELTDKVDEFYKAIETAVRFGRNGR